MKKLVLILVALVLIAAAPPMLPSSFWGHTDAPVGSVVTASIDGVVRAETQVIEYNGALTYAVDIKGTPSDQNKDVTFAVDGVDILTVVHGWQSGTNKQVDLFVGSIPPEYPEQEPEVLPAPEVPEYKPVIEQPEPLQLEE